MFKFEYELHEVRAQGLARLLSLRESTRPVPGGGAARGDATGRRGRRRRSAPAHAFLLLSLRTQRGADAYWALTRSGLSVRASRR